LKEQPEIVKALQAYNQSVQQIPRLNIRVRAITSAVCDLKSLLWLSQPSPGWR